jgi:hypothetical protein
MPHERHAPKREERRCSRGIHIPTARWTAVHLRGIECVEEYGLGRGVPRGHARLFCQLPKRLRHGALAFEPLGASRTIAQVSVEELPATRREVDASRRIDEQRCDL